MRCSSPPHGTRHKSSLPPSDSIRQINAAISYFIWKGAIFKVPLSTLQKPEDNGGKALTNVTAKCMTSLSNAWKGRANKQAPSRQDGSKNEPTWQIIKPPIYNEGPKVTGIPPSIQYRSRIRSNQRNPRKQ